MADTRDNFTATEIKAGLLVIVSVVIVVAFFAAIRGCRPRDENARSYHASFTDISGLNQNADVRFGGVKVGQVTAIEPDPNNRAMIQVTAVVEGGVPVNTASVASIAQITLTAEKHLEISTGDPAAELVADGGVLAAYTSSGGFIDIPDLEGMVVRMEALLDSVTQLMGGEPVGGAKRDIVDFAEVAASLQQTFDESTGAVREVSGLIADNREGLSEVIERLAALESTATGLMEEINAMITENRAPLNGTLVNLQKLTDDAAERLEELLVSLTVTLQHFQDMGGNASDLLDAQRPTIEGILLNLEETTRNLRRLSGTLADQPSALVRGAKTQGRKDGVTP
jgi:phospholipid/cholesterol/gamma-HCH transport system substrate-binding protein